MEEQKTTRSVHHMGSHMTLRPCSTLAKQPASGFVPFGDASAEGQPTPRADFPNSARSRPKLSQNHGVYIAICRVKCNFQVGSRLSRRTCGITHLPCLYLILYVAPIWRTRTQAMQSAGKPKRNCPHCHSRGRDITHRVGPATRCPCHHQHRFSAQHLATLDPQLGDLVRRSERISDCGRVRRKQRGRMAPQDSNAAQGIQFLTARWESSKSQC